MVYFISIAVFLLIIMTLVSILYLVEKNVIGTSDCLVLINGDQEKSPTVSSGTNLLSALIQAAKFKPTNIYLITDGLPTFGGERFKSLNPFDKCESIIGSSNKISGDCRVKLFNQSIKYVSNNGAKIDIILLPVEGDPQASPEMWKWASDTGGILISPARSWP